MPSIPTDSALPYFVSILWEILNLHLRLVGMECVGNDIDIEGNVIDIDGNIILIEKYEVKKSKH